MTLHNQTNDTFKFLAGLHRFHDPPQTINPDEKVELRYNPGTPTTGNFVTSEGQIVVEVGNTSQGNKLWGEGAYQLQLQGWGVDNYEIVRR